MRLTRRLPPIFACALAMCILWVWSYQTRSVHTDAVKIEPRRITCNVVNPHGYPVEVHLAASTVSRRSSKYLPPERIVGVTSIVKVKARASQEVEFPLPEDFYCNMLYPQVLIERVERLIDMEF